MMENTTISEFKKNWGTELASAFHLFNEYTLRLEESYNHLQNRVKEIDKEMAYTNAEKYKVISDSRRWQCRFLENWE